MKPDAYQNLSKVGKTFGPILQNILQKVSFQGLFQPQVPKKVKNPQMCQNSTKNGRVLGPSPKKAQGSITPSPLPLVYATVSRYCQLCNASKLS